MSLVILDEMDYLPFSQRGGALLFDLLSKHYECTSVIITRNVNFGEWGKTRHGLWGRQLTTGLLDRQTHHCLIVEAG